MRLRTRTGPSNSAKYLQERIWDFTDPLAYQPDGSMTPLLPLPDGELWTLPTGFKTWEEFMLDEEGDGGVFRDCYHTLLTHSFEDPVERHFNGYSSSTNYVQKIAVTVPDITGLMSDAAAPDVDMNAMADEAVAFMMPTLNEGLSLINFIYELKDLKSWTRGGSAIARIKGRRLTARGRYANDASEAVGQVPYSDLIYSLPGGRGKMYKDIVRRLTGAHLEASFGVIPLFGDIVKLVDTMGSLAFRLEILKRRANQKQVRHYRRYIPDRYGGEPTSRESRLLTTESRQWPSALSANSYQGNRAPVNVQTKTRWIQRPVYHATMRYVYTLPSMGESEERLWTYLDALGVRLDPSILWNAIPYSFIVDWIADVSGFLQSFARDNYPIKTTIVDFCHSMASHYEAEITADWLSNDPAIFPSPPYPQGYKEMDRKRTVVCYKQSYKSYNRVRYMPDIHAISTKQLKLRQGALAGSLLLNKTLSAKGRARN